MQVDDFEEFFKDLWGFEPFPWQSALMRRVVEKGWPETLDVPTSSGKTAAIDIALYHMALEARTSRPPEDRKAPWRIIFTIDRRLVVDDAYTRACKIRDRLVQAPQNTILAEVAQSLLTLGGSESEPLKVLRLRGGVPRERVFIDNPLQPVIILSTVDQVGSRLLFRGYGISPNMRPVHAALMGMDSLIILDEAHLSRPFEETLDWIRRYQSQAWAEMMVGRPNIMVRMTATPSEETEQLLQTDDWTHPVLGSRLCCSKPAKLVAIHGDKDKPEDTRLKLVEAIVTQARSLKPASGSPVVGVVVNRVATARQVFESLRAQKEDGGDAEADAILLIGRARPLDKDALVRMYLDRMKAGRKDEDNPKPLYVVATQTVEVGADLDFDALVTESAALDALRQRFGRLNRLGSHDVAHAAIVHVDYGRSKITDPIYGDALSATWKWLSQAAGRKKVIDFGIRNMGAILSQAGDVTEMLTPKKRSPLLLPAHMDMLVQTNPAPAVEPEIAPYLHGPSTESEDVQLVWRADLPAELKDEVQAIGIASYLPPNSLEVLALPQKAVRAFLAGISRSDISDVEGESTDGSDANDIRREADRRYAVVWRDDKPEVIRDPMSIVPGDILMIPSNYGGLDEFGWYPDSDRPVRDIGDEAASQRRGLLQLRLHEGTMASWFQDPQDTKEAVSMLNQTLARFETEENAELSELCDALIEDLLSLPVDEHIKKVLSDLQSDSNRPVEYPEERPEGILIRKVKPEKERLSHKILLADHCQGVGELAGTFTSGCSLPAKLVTCETLAGKVHDLGKADPRFQLSLYEANPILMRQVNKLLAKSIKPPANLPTVMKYYNLSGYPRGARHECYSIALIEDHKQLADESIDRDLLLHLVGTHHGRGRPLMPAIDDPGTAISLESGNIAFSFVGQHGLEQLDSGWIDRFWQLNRRYGYWGLAYLEMLLRLADQSQSAQEEAIGDDV